MTKSRIIIALGTLAIISTCIFFCRGNNIETYNCGATAKIKTRVGEYFKIRILENPSTGYTNRLYNANKSNQLSLVNTTYISDEHFFANKIGAGGFREFVFKAEKSGIDTVMICSKRSRDSDEKCQLSTFIIIIQ